MKRILAGVFAALLSVSGFATTFYPLQLMNPAGSTSGQFILSTGPTTPPAFTTVTLSGLGALAIANNLSDVASASTALTNLGGLSAATAASTYLTQANAASTYAVKANNLSDLASASTARTNLGLGTAATVATGTSGATIPLLSAANTWTLAQTFTVRPTFNGATPYDTGNLTIANYLTTATAATTYAPLPAGYTAYTPTITASSGTYTTVSSSGAYVQLGKLVCVRARVTVTTVGTGTSTVVSLPFAAASTNGDIQVLAGRENAVSGKMLQGFIVAGASTMTLVDYSNTTAAANGAVEVVSGCYVST